MTAPRLHGLRPTDVEIASGVVLGFDDRLVETDTVGPLVDPLAALEQTVMGALQKSPCLVSFSGGMDSSFVLAVAARAARREGLPDPIPVTWRFLDAPSADESGRQDEVIRSLGLREWSVLQAGEDLDLIGPVAATLLARYGVLFPANLHLHLPIISSAAGGSVLTGFGGDQVLASWPRPAPDLNRQLRSLIPEITRVRSRRWRGRDPFRWLHQGVSEGLQRQQMAEMRSRPVALSDRIERAMRRRDLVMTSEQFGAVAADHGVLAVHPFLDRGFQASIGDWSLPSGTAGRAEALARIGRGIFPAEVWAPRPKANFREVFARSGTRDFIQGWTGGGTDHQLVDERALRRIWSQWPMSVGSAMLIQQVWLRQQYDKTSPINSAHRAAPR